MGACVSKRASTEEKLELLCQSQFFNHLSKEELEAFATCFKVREYEEGIYVYREKDLGTEMYVLGAGEVDMSAKDKFLCTKETGDFFGEFAILNDDCKRSATVKTKSACTMLVLSRADADRFFEEQGEAMKLKLRAILGASMVETLQQIGFLNEVEHWKLCLLANLFRYETVEKDQLVVKEGVFGSEMYIVAQGSVKIWTKSEGGEEMVMANLGAGRYFGEIALMIDMPRTANVTANERCLLLVLGIDDFRNFLQVVPNLQATLSQVVKDRTAQQFKKFQVPFFQSLSEDKYNELARHCELQKFEEGEVVFHEGEPGDEFFLTVAGALSVAKEGKEVGSIASGRYFGEIALVTDNVRSATITATERTVLMVVHKRGFQSLFSDSPEAYADFSIKLSRDEVPLLAVVTHSSGKVYFRTHLEGEYSQENLDFWNEAGEFADLPEDIAAEDLSTRAQHIVDTFVKTSAEQQVNLPAAMAKGIIARMEAGDVSHDMFHDAREELLKLMDRDSFARFKNGPLFKKLLAEVGTYEDKLEAEREAAKAKKLADAQREEKEDDDRDPSAPRALASMRDIPAPERIASANSTSKTKATLNTQGSSQRKLKVARPPAYPRPAPPSSQRTLAAAPKPPATEAGPAPPAALPDSDPAPPMPESDPAPPVMPEGE